MTPELLVSLWETHSKSRGTRSGPPGGRTVIPAGLIGKAARAIRVYPDRDWAAYFKTIRETPKLNGTPYEIPYVHPRDSKRALSTDGHYKTSFRAELLWALDVNNIKDVDAGVYAPDAASS